MTAARKIARVVAFPLALILAVVVQLTIVNRAPLPGGGAPDLVLLLVTALAVTTGPMIGTLAGFAGGLALDIAPPGGHLAGEYALVFCLVGYICGRISAAVEDATGERPVVTTLILMVIGAAAGEAGKAVIGKMVSDPSVSVPAIKHVLPGAIVYDLLLAPFVLWLVSVAVRRPAPERAPEPVFTQAQRLAGVFRSASAGAAPGLRLAGSSPATAAPPVRSEPRLRLAATRSPALSRTIAASSLAQPAVAGGRAGKLSFSSAGRGNSLGASSALRIPRTLAGKAPAKGWLRAAKPAALATVVAPRLKSPGKGWLRPDKPAPAQRLKSPGRGWLRPARPARSNWYTKSPSGRWLRRGRNPWRSRSPWRDLSRWRGRKRRLPLTSGGRR